MEPFDSFDEFEETKKILTPVVEETVQVEEEIDQVSDQVSDQVEETPIPVEEPAIEADPAPKRGRKKKEV